MCDSIDTFLQSLFLQTSTLKTDGQIQAGSGRMQTRILSTGTTLKFTSFSSLDHRCQAWRPLPVRLFLLWA